MAGNDSNSDEFVKHYETLPKLFLGVAIFTIVSYVGVHRVQSLITNERLSDPASVLELVLFFLTIGYALAWYLAFYVEIKLLKREFSRHAPVPNMIVDMVVVGLTAITLAILCLAARDILYYSIIYLALLFVNEGLWWRVGREHIRNRLASASNDSRIPKVIMDATQRYYFGIAQKGRRLSIVTSAVATLGIAVYARHQGSPANQSYQVTAMVLTIVNIIQNDVQIWYLRMRVYHNTFREVAERRRSATTTHQSNPANSLPGDRSPIA